MMTCEAGMNNKRQRAPNFSADEKSLLLTLVLEKRHIIENKKTDGYTNREKEQAWVLITKQFNSQCPAGVRRSTASLQKLFHNQKKQVRKETADEKRYFRKTGGSPSQKNVRNPHYELTLATMNKHTVVGFDNDFGGDAESDLLEESNDFTIDGEHNDPEYENSSGTSHEDDVNISDSPEPCASVSSGVPKAATEDGSVEQPTPSKIPKKLNWGDYKVGHLKTPVSNKLNPGRWKARRRPTLPTVTTSQLNKSYENLADAKLELVNLELDARRRKDQHEAIVFELQKTSMELDIELKKVYLEKLRVADNLSGVAFPSQMK